jgi:acid stress chaperone HdeB
MPNDGGQKTKRTRNQLGTKIVTDIKPIAAILLIYLVTVRSAYAEVTIDVSKLTCKELMLDTITLSDNMAYWLSGYYNGKRSNTVVDLDGLRDYVNSVEQFCIRNQDVPVMKAAETVLGASKQP